MTLIDTICRDLSSIRENKPLVHSITNLVVMNETANAVLCIGALPVMAHAREEVEEMVCAAGALVLNIGTLEPDWVDAMEAAGRKANELGIPVILDPVGAGATRLRTDSSRRLLENVQVSILRGNAAEVCAVAGVRAEIRGVESMSTSEGLEKAAVTCTSRFKCTVAITGAVDYVTDGERIARIGNGHAMLSRVVGTGCTANVIIGAFAGVNRDPFQAAVGGLVAFDIAGELAANAAPDKPGTYHVELYNALYALRESDIRNLARVELS